MCGITGWVAFDRDLTRQQHPIRAMTASMACRGPDDVGSWFSRPGGHRL